VEFFVIKTKGKWRPVHTPGVFFLQPSPLWKIAAFCGIRVAGEITSYARICIQTSITVADTYVLKCCLHQRPKKGRNRHPRGFPWRYPKQIFDLCKRGRLFWAIEEFVQISHTRMDMLSKNRNWYKHWGLKQIRMPTSRDSLSSLVWNKWREGTPRWKGGAREDREGETHHLGSRRPLPYQKSRHPLK